MSKLLTPMELYHAARETCIRLYVANGGDVHATWLIKPFPGTAAIAKRERPYQPPEWTLCMPSFPLDIRLPRWKADLIGAYTVHELLHALWTDWDVVRQSRIEGLHSLCNALEDNRIEWRANTPALVMVTEARRLLQALNAHIAHRSLTTPGFALNDPKQFSFVLNLAIFHERHGYVSDFPADWRTKVRPEWLPLFDMALSRFDSLQSTGDVLQLARDLKALAAKLPKPRKPKLPPANMPGQGAPGEGETGEDELPPMPMPSRDAEITEGDDDNEPELPMMEGEEFEATFKDDDDDGEVAPDLDDPDKPKDAQDPGEPSTPTPGMEDAPAKPSEASDDTSEPSPAGDDATAGDGAGRGGAKSDDEDEPEAPAEDVTDGTQVYEEAHLDDLAAEAAKDAGKAMYQVYAEAMHAGTILNIPPLVDNVLVKGADPKIATARIPNPAKLRRHLTMAVKSPERVANERYQPSGRLDMRNLVGLSIGASNVFRRRVEEEGREAAVSILLDISGSMAGERLASAKAMAIHMADALKAAGVRFEVAGFDDASIVRPKTFAEGWAEPTRRKLAGLRHHGGTAMLPAMKGQAERLLKVANVTRRILLVLTDGQDSYAPAANAALCAFYAGRGVEIVGIGLQTSSVNEPFRGKACVVWDCRALADEGLKALVKLLDAGAPRAA